MSMILGTMSTDGFQSCEMIKLFRFAKFGKIMRIAGLLRLPKLIRIADMFAEMFFFTDNIKLMLNMAKLLFTVIFLCHLIGCMWYMLGSFGESVGDTWTKQNIPLHTCAKDAYGFQDAGQFFQ